MPSSGLNVLGTARALRRRPLLLRLRRVAVFPALQIFEPLPQFLPMGRRSTSMAVVFMNSKKG